jgi:hypothetical protein
MITGPLLDLSISEIMALFPDDPTKHQAVSQESRKEHIRAKSMGIDLHTVSSQVAALSRSTATPSGFRLH